MALALQLLLIMTKDDGIGTYANWVTPGPWVQGPMVPPIG